MLLNLLCDFASIGVPYIKLKILRTCYDFNYYTISCQTVFLNTYILAIACELSVT